MGHQHEWNEQGSNAHADFGVWEEDGKKRYGYDVGGQMDSQEIPYTDTKIVTGEWGDKFTAGPDGVQVGAGFDLVKATYEPSGQYSSRSDDDDSTSFSLAFGEGVGGGAYRTDR